MSAELAVALTAIAAKSVVASVINGTTPNRDAWASVGTQVVDVLVSATSKQESTLSRLTRLIEGLPARQFDVQMAAGRRFLRDLPAAWRTDMDRRDLIREARGEFVRAVAVAQQMGDARRQALAEVAIAGCWLWVLSIPDVKLTLDGARRLLERAMLLGAPSTSLLADHAAIVALEQALSAAATPARALIAPNSSPSAPVVPSSSLNTPERRTGTVKVFNITEGRGLITPDDDSADVIFDRRSGPGWRGLRRSQRVSFATALDPKGPYAKEVRLRDTGASARWVRSR